MFTNDDLVVIRRDGVFLKWNCRISRYPVTVRDYCELIEGKAGSEEDDGLVKAATWREAIHYCNELSRKAGLPPSYNEAKGRLIDAKGNRVGDPSAARGFRLPTSEEWTFAAKGWGRRQDPNGWKAIHEQHYWKASDPERYLTVANLVENSVGLFGMLGEVHEWCSDTDAKEGFINKRCGWKYYYQNYDEIVYCVEKKIVADTDVSGFRVLLTGAGTPLSHARTRPSHCWLPLWW